jgi:hypothetical protein
MARLAAVNHRFQRMSTMKDFRVDKGFTDPRGWKVIDAEGRAVARVIDLVVDTDRMAASFLDLELDLKALDLPDDWRRDDRRLLVPMSLAVRDGERRQLIVRELTRSRVTGLQDAWSEHEVRFWAEAWTGPPAAAAEPPAVVSPIAKVEVEGTAAEDERTHDVRVPVLYERPFEWPDATTEDGTVVRQTEDVTRTRRVIE